MPMLRLCPMLPLIFMRFIVAGHTAPRPLARDVYENEDEKRGMQPQQRVSA